MQHMMVFVGSIIDFLARELTQSAFWYQVLAIVVAVLLSYFVARVCSQKVATWEENFSKETISHKLCRFSLELTRKLFFSIFAALFLSLGASTISDMGLLTDDHFNLIHVGYQIFYAWALLVFLIQVFGAFIAPDSVLLQIKKPLYILFWILAALEIVGVLPKFIQAMREINLPVGPDSLTLWALVVGIITVIVSVLIAQWLSGLCDSALYSAKDIDNNLKIVLSRLIHIAFIAIAILISLSSVGLDLTILSVFGGAIGVGLGFGLQKIASNYISGFIILCDKSVKIGDMVDVGGFVGIITQINTRYSVLRNTSGEEMIVPNENFVTGSVKSYSHTDSASLVKLDVSCAYESNVDDALRILSECVMAQPRVLKDGNHKPWFAVTEFVASGINLRAAFWIDDAREGTVVLKSNIFRAVLKAYSDAGIEIPYDKLDVTIKNAVAETPAAMPKSEPSAALQTA